MILDKLIYTELVSDLRGKRNRYKFSSGLCFFDLEVIRMSRSYRAEEIDREYRREQYYKQLKGQRCKEMDCVRCKFFEVCMEGGNRDD